jgi:hypothetical protein
MRASITETDRLDWLENRHRHHWNLLDLVIVAVCLVATALLTAGCVWAYRLLVA